MCLKPNLTIITPLGDGPIIKLIPSQDFPFGIIGPGPTLLMIPAGTDPSPPVITDLRDHFIGADGSPVIGRTADTGQIWGGIGTPSIQNNAATNNNPGFTDTYIIADAFGSEGVGTVDVLIPLSVGNGVYCSLIGRAVDTNNFWMIQLVPVSGGTQGQLYLYNVTAGVPSGVANSAFFPLTAGATYMLKLEMTGIAIVGSIWSGSTLIDYCNYNSATFQTATYWGLRIFRWDANNFPSVGFQNLVVTH